MGTRTKIRPRIPFWTRLRLRKPRPIRDAIWAAGRWWDLAWIVGPLSAVRLVWAAYWMIPEDHDWVKPEEVD